MCDTNLRKISIYIYTYIHKCTQNHASIYTYIHTNPRVHNYIHPYLSMYILLCVIVLIMCMLPVLYLGLPKCLFNLL